MPTTYKLVVCVPLSHADVVRGAMVKAGGGNLGKYSHCSFSVRGVGRFFPGEGAQPHIGRVGNLEEVEEERIEVTCASDVLENVIVAIKQVHPYEEAVIDVYPLENR